MTSEEIKKVAVLGAGAMGNGIAQVALMAGYNVAMRDIEQKFVDKGLENIKESLAKFVTKGKISEEESNDCLTRLEALVDLETAVKDADLIIEAAPEDLKVKKNIFADIDSLAPANAILASNTSTMSITEIASATKREDKVIGMHFFNPPVMMKLVEVIYGDKASDEAVNAAYDVAIKMNKVPVIVKKDSPGFIYNRINAPTGLLLQKILEAGTPKPEEFDAVFKNFMPMAPFELSDFVGLDVVVNIKYYYAETLSPEYAPEKFLLDLVNAGHLGKKSGKGIYDWSEGRPVIDTSNPTNEYDATHMVALQVNEGTKLLEEGVVDDPNDIDTAMVNGGGGMGPFTLAKNFGYDVMVQKCNELADKFKVEVFRPTETLKKGNIQV